MPLTRTTAALSLTAALALVPAAASAAAAAPATATAHAFPGTIPLAAGSQPEGIARAGGTRFFAGSRLDGAVYIGDVRTGTRTQLVRGTAGTAARGLQLDRRTGLLWVAGDVRKADGTTTSTVTAYDSRTGAQVQRFVVPGQRFLNDVQVTRNGVYVTDSLNAQLVVVRDGALRLRALTGDWVQPAAGGFGANGIRELRGGDLVITNSATGGLFRVDPATGVADRIELRGPALSSGDGLELRGSTLYVVYGFGTEEIAVVHLEHGGRTGTVTGRLGDADLDRPTTAVLIAGALYAVNGRFSTPPTATTPYDVVRVALR